jgi:SAM-dependent methyltransferase
MDFETKIFDETAVEYDKIIRENIGHFGNDISYYPEHKAIIASQTIDIHLGKILEFGCGTGRNIPYLKQYFPETEIYGYDLSKASLDIAKKNNAEIQFLTEKEIVQFRGFFDFILIANVFHHIPLRFRFENMSLILSLLKDRGEIIVVEHNPFNPVTRQAVNTCPLDINVELIKPVNMRALLSEAGFQIIQMEYTLFFPAALKKLQKAEKYISFLPLGGQYFIHAKKNQK